MSKIKRDLWEKLEQSNSSHTREWREDYMQISQQRLCITEESGVDIFKTLKGKYLKKKEYYTQKTFLSEMELKDFTKQK